MLPEHKRDDARDGLTPVSRHPYAAILAESGCDDLEVAQRLAASG